MVALLHQGRAGLSGVAADQHIVALGGLGHDRACRLRAAILGVASDIAGLRRPQDKIVIRCQRNAGLRRHLGDAGGDIEVDRLDDDRVDALGDDVLGLRNLVLGIVFG